MLQKIPVAVRMAAIVILCGSPFLLRFLPTSIGLWILGSGGSRAWLLLFVPFCIIIVLLHLLLWSLRPQLAAAGVGAVRVLSDIPRWVLSLGTALGVVLVITGLVLLPLAYLGLSSPIWGPRLASSWRSNTPLFLVMAGSMLWVSTCAARSTGKRAKTES